MINPAQDSGQVGTCHWYRWNNSHCGTECTKHWNALTHTQFAHTDTDGRDTDTDGRDKDTDGSAPIADPSVEGPSTRWAVVRRLMRVSLSPRRTFVLRMMKRHRHRFHRHRYIHIYSHYLFFVVSINVVRKMKRKLIESCSWYQLILQHVNVQLKSNKSWGHDAQRFYFTNFVRLPVWISHRAFIPKCHQERALKEHFCFAIKFWVLSSPRMVWCPCHYTATEQFQRPSFSQNGGMEHYWINLNYTLYAE